MKKIFGIIALCAMLIGGAVTTYIYADGNMCSQVSGASVSGYYSNNVYCVKLTNNSGSRCSASITVQGKVDGTWEDIDSFTLSAANGSYSTKCVDLSRVGATAARISSQYIYRCD